MASVSTLVNVPWLAERLASPSLSSRVIRVLDCSWYLPKQKRDQRGEYKLQHIPGALFFDQEDCCDKASSYDNMLPSPEDFESYVGSLGVDNNTHVVVYDGSDMGLFSAQRVWWMFRVFGHPLVSVLNGGLAKWRAEGRGVSNEIPKVDKAAFKATYTPALVRDFDFMTTNLADKTAQVVDARPPGRFNGTEPEPRADCEPGHIPNSLNMPFGKILDPESKTVKPPEKLREVFAAAGADLSGPMVATCGSGMTACGLVLAAYLCGKEDVPVFDGAWVEWFKRAKPENIISEAKKE
ncbi:MPST [Branchiostoma lanceolatum]|nr:MPST [Branchiostoma lanceolatum]